MNNLEQKTYFGTSKKQIALLIDPDKQQTGSLTGLINIAIKAKVDYFFVGGSLLVKPIEPVVKQCKALSDIPVVIFPGSGMQLTKEADAVLFLSLISGRNPEYLIGQHVQSAPFLKQAQIDVIPTGYMLVDGGRVTSVEYVSNTKPIPADKTDIAVATALAGRYLGMQCIYLEAGSGAVTPVPEEMISAVKRSADLPLIVGGGLRTSETVRKAFLAGADVVVLGTAIEQDPMLLQEICNTR